MEGGVQLAFSSFRSPAGGRAGDRTGDRTGDRVGRRRAIAFVAVLVIHAGLAFLLLTLTPEMKMRAAGIVQAMAMRAIPSPKPEKAAVPEQKAVAPKAAEPRRVLTPPVEDPKAPAAPWVIGDPRLSSFDIRKLPSQETRAVEQADAGVPGSPGDSPVVPGGGPNGEPLYQAEWQREPTDAELAFYLPKGAPPESWALIVCRTIERFQVDDCQALGEAPRGSGLARAMQAAAWQFRVRPPRVGGKAMTGTWVQIRFDFGTRPERAS